MRTRRTWLVALLAVVLGVVVWAFVRTDGDRSKTQGERAVATRAVAGDAAAETTRAPASRASRSATRSEPKQPTPRKRARRDALRNAIVDALAQQRRSESAPNEPRKDGARPPSGELRDRIGGRDELLAALNGDFMPLAEECIDHARQRTPELAGMLALELEVIGDPDLGAVIETVSFPEANEVSELDLLECIRQTALSTELPPPPQGGRDELMITMPIEPQG